MRVELTYVLLRQGEAAPFFGVHFWWPHTEPNIAKTKENLLEWKQGAGVLVRYFAPGGTPIASMVNYYKEGDLAADDCILIGVVVKPKENQWGVISL